jgi:hypothetical protein
MNEENEKGDWSVAGFAVFDVVYTLLPLGTSRPDSSHRASPALLSVEAFRCV